MENKLTKEEVMHVARLARINVSEEEIERYQVTLKQLLDEVKKIRDVKDRDKELMFSPTTHLARTREDEVDNMVSFDEIKKNAPKVVGDYIEVPVMIND
jgi:aspartyl-tRNA(Asn)/glutamyl-tRNA(Gln) amidotransferase subunit C